MEKKVPEVGKKMVVKIHGELMSIKMTKVLKVKDGYKFKGEILCSDLRLGENETQKNKWMKVPITISGELDEYGNWGE